MNQIEMTGYPTDNFTSRESYNKAVEGLKNSVGNVVVVVKSESAGGFRGGSVSFDNFEERYSLGVLSSLPTFEGGSSKIVMPMEKHYTGALLGMGKPEREDGGVDFHCANPERLEILADGSGVGTRGAIRLYTTEKAVAHCFDLLFPAVDYIRMVGVLGGEVSESLKIKHKKGVEDRIREVMGGIEAMTRRTLSSELSAENLLELRGLYEEAFDWDLRDDLSPLDLGRGIKVDVGEYLGSS